MTNPYFCQDTGEAETETRERLILEHLPQVRLIDAAFGIACRTM